LPIFIIEKDAENNIIYVGKSDTHAGLYRKGLFIPKNFAHWIREDLTLSIGEMKEFLVRIRYRQELVKANLIMKDSGLFIIFEGWMSSIAAGQFAVWYNGEELVGSGVID
jgi:tRNA-specific 2-thiouridylase